MTSIFSLLLPKNNRALYPVVVAAGVFGGKIGVLGRFLVESEFCKCSFCCYNCYKLIFISIESSTVKDLRLLQAAKITPSLLQVVTLLLQVVTKFVTEFVTEAKYWYSVIYKGCYKCYKCNRKKLDGRKKYFLA